MMTWSETKKACFKWNQYVKMFVDGEQVTDAIQVRDTAEYDEYEVDEMFGYNGMTKIMLVKPNVDENNREAETAKLHTYNECDERPVEMMVGKAMCAWANWQTELKCWNECVDDCDKYGMHVHERAASGYVNEYEATVMCIGMFVSDSVLKIRAYTIERAKNKFGI